MDLVNKYKDSPYYCGDLSQFVSVNPKTDCSKLNDSDIVSFVPMTNVQEKNNIVEYDLVPYAKVKKGFTVFKKNDIIWAKITPCMQNGKSCTTEKMSTEIGFGSTEFHVIRALSDDVYMPFLWSILSNDNVLLAAQAIFSGSAGQQRVPSSFLESFPAVLPRYSKQKELVKNLETKLAKRNERIKKAEKQIIDNKKSIENRFNLNQSENKLCFAVRLKNIDGVIDVKRYSTIGNLEHKLVISDICDVVDERVNVSSFGNCIVDWIRIDDLQNQPLDIEQVRTMPATEIDGTFFEVQKDDILVARLGPTILNQKIVMVRNIERTTIASSEFIVLRCKKGYNPEAVMSILKTDYYMNLMYSNARGSTPSRYRLNRSDMLKLPFPDIADVQDEVAENAISAREIAKNLRVEAEQEWQAAKAQFEKELLGE